MQIRSDGAIISYTDVGSGTPILFLHALGRSASDWSTIVEGMSSDFRCIAIDFPGHGSSEWSGRYGFADMARTARDLVSELGLDSFSIVAHSMGATVAWILAPDFGGRVKALVIEDTPAPTDRHVYPDVPVEPPPKITHDWEAHRQIFSQLNAPDPAWRTRISDLETPTLLISGSDDNEEMSETSVLLANSQVITIAVGHWVHQEAPEPYLDALRHFLKPTDPE